MLPILAPFSAKRIATQILVIGKLDGRKNFCLRENFLNCSLRIKTLDGCQWRRSNVFIVNCEHISKFALTVDFEQAVLCWVHIKKTNTFEDRALYFSILNVSKIL